MQKGDRARDLVLSIIESASTPLQTPEIVAKVQEQIPSCTRTIILRRLNILRGDGLILGKQAGSGKGVWVWWSKKLLARKARIPDDKDKVSQAILQLLGTTSEVLETSEIVQRVADAIPRATRTIVLRRLNILRGDQKLRGKFTGSGKGVWIWWRCDAKLE